MLKEGNKPRWGKLRSWLGLAVLLVWGAFWMGWFVWENIKIFMTQGL
jgi:hypothetical protein